MVEGKIELDLNLGAGGGGKIENATREGDKETMYLEVKRKLLAGTGTGQFTAQLTAAGMQQIGVLTALVPELPYVRAQT